jgi:hypothetical protein
MSTMTTGSLRAEIAPWLSGQALDLLDEIENYAGLPVGLSAPEAEHLRNPAAARVIGIYYDEHSATILRPPGVDLDETALVHELLHLRLKWMERQPVLAFPGGQSLDLVDNEVDHLSIVPEMRRRGYEETQWRNEFKHVLRRCESALADKKPVRETLLRSWLGLSLVHDLPDVRNAYFAMLGRTSLRGAAKQLLEAVNRARTDRRLIFRAIADASNIPAQALCLRSYDIKAGRIVEEPL